MRLPWKTYVQGLTTLNSLYTIVGIKQFEIFTMKWIRMMTATKLTGADVKNIRDILGVTQEDLATILGVTPVTVGRYENGQAKPTGSAESKLLHLISVLKDEKERGVLQELAQNPQGGIAAIAGLCAVAVALLPSVGLLSCIGLRGVMGGIVGNLMSNAIKKLQD